MTKAMEQAASDCAVGRRSAAICPPLGLPGRSAPPKLSVMRRAPGFTLLELMITITVAGVLLAIGIPNFRSALADSRLAAQTNELSAALSAARGEAMKRGVRVTICRSTTGTGCSTTAAGNWREGWLVFAETAAAGTIGTVDAGEPTIAVRSEIAGNNSINFTGNPTWRVTYNTQGMTTSLGTFRVCDNTRSGYQREIAVARTGRSRMQRFNGNGVGCS